MVVTHEMGFARKVSHRVVFMDTNRVMEDCPTSQFFSPTEQRSERAAQFLAKILQHEFTAPSRIGRSMTSF